MTTDIDSNSQMSGISIPMAISLGHPKKTKKFTVAFVIKLTMPILIATNKKSQYEYSNSLIK
jgi:hypothetical protein